MAIYHFSLQNISAGKGKTAIASAAYRSGEVLYSDKEERYYKYNRNVKPETFILAPNNAPEWATDRNKLWNEVEKIEKAKNSRYAKEINLALPVELSHEQQKELLLEYCQEIFVDDGMVADIAIHRDHEENPHAHIMLTNRPFNEDGSWGIKSKKVYINDEKGEPIYLDSGYRKSRKEPTTNWDKKETINLWRKSWADYTNKFLKLNNIDQEISHLSNEKQGKEEVATVHEGYGKNGEENKEINQQIKEHNKNIQRKNKVFERKETYHKFNELTKKFSAKDRERIKELSKSLKTFINIENIEDKKRMIHNWKTSILGKSFLGEEQYKNLLKISKQEKDIIEADKILTLASKELIQEYYPELNIDKFMDDEIKNLAQVTLFENRKLEQHELEAEIEDFKLHLLEKQVVLVTKKPYISWINLEQQINNDKEKLENILSRYNKTLSTISEVDDVKQFYGKDFKIIQILTKDITRNTLLKNTVENFYYDFLTRTFPEVTRDKISVEDAEKIYRLVNYINPKIKEIKYRDIENWLENKFEKFSTDEREQGLKYLEGKEYLVNIENKELKRVLQEYSLTTLFLEECQEDPTLNKKRITEVSNSIAKDHKQQIEDRKSVQTEYKNVAYNQDKLSNRMVRTFTNRILQALFSVHSIQEYKKRSSKLKKLQKNMQTKGLHR